MCANCPPPVAFIGILSPLGDKSAAVCVPGAIIKRKQVRQQRTARKFLHHDHLRLDLIGLCQHASISFMQQQPRKKKIYSILCERSFMHR